MFEKFILSYADYAIVGLLLTVSALIGLYFMIFGQKQETNDEYLLAGRNMSIFPISFSLMATFMSSTTLMGIPAEMYLFGTNMTFMNLGFILGPIIASYLFIPIYYNIGVSTSYEYLEKRFGKTTRRILCLIFLLQNILFNGVSLYAPALALSAVTNLSLWISIVGTGAVCTFYCTIGGMKAVIWTDVFQSSLMYFCLIAIIVKGCIDLDGIQNIFKTAYEGGRILLPTFKMDFSTRYTMWSIFLQGLIITTASYGAFQIQVQRQLTLKNLHRSRLSSFLSIPMIVTFQLLCCMCGIIFYVYFQSCDPVLSPEHLIESYDQLMPYYIISTMREYPGLPGLCIAGIFAASLSSISSAVNSMAAVTYEDLIRPVWPNFSRDVFITKAASVFYGALSILVSFLAASMGNLVKASVLVVGMVSGPALGVFLLASLTTTANEMGVNAGLITGFLLAGFITFVPNERYYPFLPLETDCSYSDINADNLNATKDNVSFALNFTNHSTHEAKSSINDLQDNFPVSYMWISPLSLLVCLVIGYFGSWIITCIRGISKPVSPELLSPIHQRFYFNDNCIRNNSIEKEVPIDNDTGKKTTSSENRFQNSLPLKNFEK